MRCFICGSKECCAGSIQESFEELNDLVQDILASIPGPIINGYDFDKKLAKIVQKYENCS